MIEAWVDGSCNINPGTKAGFAAIFVENGQIIDTYSKRYKSDKAEYTNNQMELKGILYAACQSILQQGSARIHSDSAYAINCISKWAYGWESRGWLKGDNTEPENLDIIKELYYLYNKYNIELIKTKGHKDDIYNNLADKLAKGEK